MEKHATKTELQDKSTSTRKVGEKIFKVIELPIDRAALERDQKMSDDLWRLDGYTPSSDEDGKRKSLDGTFSIRKFK